jgi:hypothetical protein
MHRYLAIGKLVVLCVALLALAVVRAEAGASASAPTKNQRSSQLAQHQTGHNTPITEYSSSSARNRSH